MSQIKLPRHFLLISSLCLFLAISFFNSNSAQAKELELGTENDILYIPGQIINTKLYGTANRCLYVDPVGRILAKDEDCGAGLDGLGDDLGNHIAAQNIRLNNFWLSGDGGNEGVFVNSLGRVGIATNNPGSYALNVNGTSFFSAPIIAALATESNHAATKSYMDSSLIAWNQILPYPRECPKGQFLIGLDRELICAIPTATGGSITGSGTSNYISKWGGSSNVGNSLLYDNGANISLGSTLNQARLQVQSASGEALRLVTNASYSPLNIRNSANTADIFRVDQSGSLAVGTIPAARISGLGALASLHAVTTNQITDYTISNIDISSIANIAASKLQYGEFFIDSAGTRDQVWTSAGSGRGFWANPASGSSGLPASDAYSTLRHSGKAWEPSTFLLLSNDNVGINVLPEEMVSCNNSKMSVAGLILAPQLYFGQQIVGVCAPGASIKYDSRNYTLEIAGPNQSLMGGNVGIGATASFYKLQVAGDVYSTGSIRGSFRSANGNSGQTKSTAILNGTANCALSFTNGILTANSCPETGGDPITKG